jgi:hypothetical protein
MSDMEDVKQELPIDLERLIKCEEVYAAAVDSVKNYGLNSKCREIGNHCDGKTSKKFPGFC